jgi:alpha-glucosidase
MACFRLSSEIRWWQRGPIYQLYPLSFQDSDGNGQGDLPGILSRLGYLQWLGIDALWLGPIYPSPMKDFGYDIAEFTGVDPIFGSLDHFDRLIEGLHARGIRLILDFVPNHTADRHPWFTASRSSRRDPKRQWYIWADPAPSGGPPNNWLSRFGGSAWEWDEKTEQYYYHAFLKEQPDLNWRNPEVRAAMADVLRFWLDRGVDGFRIDAAAVLAEDDLLRDDPPNREFNERTPPPEKLKRVFTDARPEVLDWLAEMRTVVNNFPDRVLLAEVDTSPERVPQFYGDEHRPMIHLPLNYRILDTAWKPGAIAPMIDEYLASVPEHGWPCWVIGSHDKKRIAALIGAEQARVAAILFLTLPGTPIFYAGDELGMAGSAGGATALDPFEQRVPGYGLNRDPERSPMQWSPGPHAGFTTGTPWLPVGNDYPQRNVDSERADPRSLLMLYCRLLEMRRTQPSLLSRAYAPVFINDRTFIYRRGNLLAALNFTGAPQSCSLPAEMRGRILLSTELDRDGDLDNTSISLRANEGVIISLTND